MSLNRGSPSAGGPVVPHGIPGAAGGVAAAPAEEAPQALAGVALVVAFLVVEEGRLQLFQIDSRRVMNATSTEMMIVAVSDAPSQSSAKYTIVASSAMEA
ncbi:hypothetical protein WU86_06040 [Corynebacterium xerosis]|nr:hypothetical protein WU86_06040 [Corynebacterium xerosis]